MCRIFKLYRPIIICLILFLASSVLSQVIEKEQYNNYYSEEFYRSSSEIKRLNETFFSDVLEKGFKFTLLKIFLYVDSSRVQSAEKNNGFSWNQKDIIIVTFDGRRGVTSRVITGRINDDAKLGLLNRLYLKFNFIPSRFKKFSKIPSRELLDIELIYFDDLKYFAFKPKNSRSINNPYKVFRMGNKYQKKLAEKLFTTRNNAISFESKHYRNLFKVNSEEVQDNNVFYSTNSNIDRDISLLEYDQLSDLFTVSLFDKNEIMKGEIYASKDLKKLYTEQRPDLKKIVFLRPEEDFMRDRRIESDVIKVNIKGFEFENINNIIAEGPENGISIEDFSIGKDRSVPDTLRFYSKSELGSFIADANFDAGEAINRADELKKNSIPKQPILWSSILVIGLLFL